MDVHKLQEKPLILNFYKRLGDSKDISRNDKGEVTNEWQPIKFVTLKTLQDRFKGIIAMGYATVEIADLGDFDKKDVEDVLSIMNEKQPAINKDIEALKTITQNLLEQNEILMKELEANKKNSNVENVVDSELEDLKIQYKEKYNKNVPPNKAKDKEWILSKINE